MSETLCLCMWCYTTLRLHQGGADMSPNPRNDVVAQQNAHEVYVSHENYRNPLREAKYQRELLKDYFNHVRHWLGRRPGSEMCQPATLGAEAGMYQSFSGLLSVLFRTNQLFQELLFQLVLLKLATFFLKRNPLDFQQVSKLLPTKSQVFLFKTPRQSIFK